MKKFEFTGETKTMVDGTVLHRIKALVCIELGCKTIKIGELGGWIEKEENLSHNGDAWVYGNARVYGDAWVSGDAEVYGDARVYGGARVYGDARVYKCEHILVIGPIGSRNAFTTFFRTKDRDIKVACGCFLGTTYEFLEKVKKTHGDSKYGVVYRAAVEVALAHIDISEEEPSDI